MAHNPATLPLYLAGAPRLVAVHYRLCPCVLALDKVTSLYTSPYFSFNSTPLFSTQKLTGDLPRKRAGDFPSLPPRRPPSRAMLRVPLAAPPSSPRLGVCMHG